MTKQEAYNFIKNSSINPHEVWADLGAGSGTFTLPISQLLGSQGKVFAIDNNHDVLKISNLNTSQNQAEIIPIHADFTLQLDLPMLDGIFLANALHYVQDQERILKQYIHQLKPKGKLVFIEYDQSKSSPWIPYPIPFEKLKKMTVNLDLTEAVELNRRASRYGNGYLYLAISQKK